MNRSEALNELAAALAKAQGMIRGAVKDRTNPHFRSNYADLSSIWEACREPLASVGLAVTQLPAVEEGAVVVETVLLHSSGQWCSSRLRIPLAQQTAHAIGSAITYARRYSLAAMVGVAPEDDDAEMASTSPGPDPVRPAQSVLGVSPQQLRDLNTLISAMSFAKREEARAFCAWLIGRHDLESVKDLGLTDVRSIVAQLGMVLPDGRLGLNKERADELVDRWRGERFASEVVAVRPIKS